MQYSLFDDENLCRIGWQQALKEFDLLAALENLYSWRKTLDVPPNIEQKIEAVQRLQKEIYSNTDNLLNALSMFRKEYAETDFLSVLQKEFKYLREGLNRALALNMDADRCDFLVPGLHPAEILVELEEYERTVKTTDCFIRQFGEHSYLRQIQAFALFKSGLEERAYTASNIALFYDPLNCKERFLLPGAYTNKYLYLRHKTGREETAWLRLPFALWLDGKTYISPNEAQFEKELLTKIDQNKEKAKRDSGAGQQQFNHLLYVAEIERLRYPRGHETEALKGLRRSMKELNQELFGAYIGILKPFRNF